MGESKLIFLKTEERRCDALSKLKINQMTFNMNMFEKSVNEEKATLDDEYTTFSAASYFVPFISHVAVFIICKFRNTKHSLPNLGSIAFTQRGSDTLCGIAVAM